jgi:multidrug efflux system outer membrane protein
MWRPVALTLDSTSDLAWLDVLRDTQVVTLVQRALANNRNIRLAEARVREYRAERGVASADFFPQLTANGSTSKNKMSLGASAPVKYDAVRATADLAWELDFWGRIRRQRQAANFDLQGREEDVRATVLTLVSDVVNTYLQLREADENLHIAEQTLTSRKATLELARRRFAQGLISELDVRQFEANVADPAARVAQFAQQRAQQENALSLLLGESPGPIARGRPLEDVIQSVSVPDSAPAALIAHRPDVLAAQRDWQAAIARVGVAEANRLPTVKLSGEYGSQRPTTDGLFTPQGEVYTVQAGISLPLFTGGRLLNAQRAAQARAEEAKNAYQQTVLAAQREASDALAGVRLNRDQLVAQETQVRALETAFSLAQRRYASGVSSYLEVLDAQRSLFTAQLALVQGEQQYLSSIVQLYKALGGSWQTSTNTAVTTSRSRSR